MIYYLNSIQVQMLSESMRTSLLGSKVSPQTGDDSLAREVVAQADTPRSPHRASVPSSALAPFQTICTPMQSRMNAVSRSKTFIPVSPIIRLTRSA